MTSNTLQVPPNSARLIESLRSTGYDFNSAVADIIDNSIAADATLINIAVSGDSPDSLRVRIADNGHGMARDDVLNAMTYGSSLGSNPKSLGKFGLGLKTASSAICRSFSVLSRTGASDLTNACWDLDHVCQVEDWELLLPPANKDDLDLLQKTAGKESGTIVTWSKIDRLFKSQEAPLTAETGNLLTVYTNRLHFYLAGVFERFLNPKDERARTLQINVNGNPVKPWCPFAATQTQTVCGERLELDATVAESGSHGILELQAFILPREEQFDDAKSAKRAHLSQHLQGFYVYRENRLIQSKDWLGLFNKGPAFTLLRCELSFGAELDEIFHVDIKKSRMVLSEKLKSWLNESFLPEPKQIAQKRFLHGQRLKALENAEQAHDASNKRILARVNEFNLPQLREYVTEHDVALIANEQGIIERHIPIADSSEKAQHQIYPVSEEARDELWYPCIVGNHLAVALNTAHPFYTGMYLTHIDEGVSIQTLDAFIWSLAQSELAIADMTNHQAARRFRKQTGALLAGLLRGLPELLL